MTSDLQNRYGGAAQTAKKWADSLTTWNQNMPPRRPQAAPTLADSASWPDKAPANSVWSSYAQVTYAVGYANSSGPSPISGWSESVDIDGKAHPSLTLPPDPLQMATEWYVYRRFFDGAGTASPVKLIAVVPVGGSAGTYQDTHN